MKTFNKIILLASLVLIAGCELDNYKGPTQTLTGKVINKITDKPLNTEVGGGGIRIRLDELSYSDNPQPYYFNAMQDGTFNNSKIFEGKYRISVQGAFVPIFQKNNQGDIIVDQRKTKKIEGGQTKISFEVTPLLNIEWLGEPEINSDSTVTVKVKITRGPSKSKFQKPVTDIRLFVNRYRQIGNNSYNPNLTKRLSFGGTDGNKKLGKEISLTTNKPLTEDNIKTWYLKVGARTDYGQKRYNYSSPKKVLIQ